MQDRHILNHHSNEETDTHSETNNSEKTQKFESHLSFFLLVSDLVRKPWFPVQDEMHIYVVVILSILNLRKFSAFKLPTKSFS